MNNVVIYTIWRKFTSRENQTFIWARMASRLHTQDHWATKYSSFMLSSVNIRVHPWLISVAGLLRIKTKPALFLHHVPRVHDRNPQGREIDGAVFVVGRGDEDEVEIPAERHRCPPGIAGVFP